MEILERRDASFDADSEFMNARWRRAWKENKYVFTAGEGIKKKNSRVEEIIVLQFERMFEFISRRLKKKSR